MGKWSKIRELSAGEILILVQAAFLLPLIALGLRLRGFNGVYAILAGDLPPLPFDEKVVQEKVRQTMRMVRVAADSGVFKVNCLPRSLALWCLLRRQGIASELRIGVRKEQGRLEAHAWVEKDGAPLNDASDVHDRFAAFKEGVAGAGEVLR